MKNKSKKYICMVLFSKYATDTRVRNEAELLAELQEYEVTILSLKDGDLPRKYQLDGVKVIELNVSQYRGKSNAEYLICYLKFLLASFMACTLLFLKKKVDIVHVHNMPNFLVYCGIIPRLFGKKIILDIHDSVPETYGAKFNNKLKMVFKLLCLEEAISCRFADEIICVNHPQKDILVKRGIPAYKITIFMNVPNQNWFNRSPLSRSREKEIETFKLVYHGTLAKRLGIDLTIKAVAKLIDKIPKVEFNIFGEGDDFNEFISLSKRIGIEKQIHFNKAVPIKSLVPMLQQMHLGVVANRKNIATELMLPVKLLEYVALNIPVVAPRLKTIQLYFDEGMVNYFEPENVDSLAMTIFEAYKNEAERVKKAENAKKFLNSYGWETNKNNLIRLYRALT